MPQTRLNSTTSSEVDDARPPKSLLTPDEALELLLKRRGCYESRDEVRRRQVVLTKLQELFDQWVNSLSLVHGIHWQDVESYNGRIVVYGSYLLEVSHKGADIDLLCLAPAHVSRVEYFKSFFQLLSGQPEVEDIRSIEEAYVPVLKMRWDQFEIDITFARLTTATVPHDLNAIREEDLIRMDAKCLRSLNGYRSTLEIMNRILTETDVPLAVFRLALRAVKLWAKCQGLYSNILGYLGGFSWAMMVAKACLMNPRINSASHLVASFFILFAEWPWPEPVQLTTRPEMPSVRWSQVMPIITPTYPHFNSTFNVSLSTRIIIQNKMLQAARYIRQHHIDDLDRFGSLLTSVSLFSGSTEISDRLKTDITSVSDESMLKQVALALSMKRKGVVRIHGHRLTSTWSSLFKNSHVFHEYDHFVMVMASAVRRHVEWFGLIESKIRHFVSHLERHFATIFQSARVWPKPFTQQRQHHHQQQQARTSSTLQPSAGGPSKPGCTQVTTDTNNNCSQCYGHVCHQGQEDNSSNVTRQLWFIGVSLVDNAGLGRDLADQSGGGQLRIIDLRPVLKHFMCQLQHQAARFYTPDMALDAHYVDKARLKGQLSDSEILEIVLSQAQTSVVDAEFCTLTCPSTPVVVPKETADDSKKEAGKVVLMPSSYGEIAVTQPHKQQYDKGGRPVARDTSTIEILAVRPFSSAPVTPAPSPVMEEDEGLPTCRTDTMTPPPYLLRNRLTSSAAYTSSSSNRVSLRAPTSNAQPAVVKHPQLGTSQAPPVKGAVCITQTSVGGQVFFPGSFDVTTDMPASIRTSTASSVGMKTPAADTESERGSMSFSADSFPPQVLVEARMTHSDGQRIPFSPMIPIHPSVHQFHQHHAQVSSPLPVSEAYISANGATSMRYNLLPAETCHMSDQGYFYQPRSASEFPDTASPCIAEASSKAYLSGPVWTMSGIASGPSISGSQGPPGGHAVRTPSTFTATLQSAQTDQMAIRRRRVKDGHIGPAVSSPTPTAGVGSRNAFVRHLHHRQPVPDDSVFV